MGYVAEPEANDEEQEKQNLTTVNIMDKECPPPDKIVRFEDIFDVIGHFGRFQIRVFAILTMMDMATGQAMMLFIFSSLTPPWKCTEFSDNSTLPNNTARACTSINQSKCIGFEFDSSDSLTTIVTEYDLVCDLDYIPQLSVSLQMAGVLFGALASGYIADLFGRKKTLVVTCTMTMVSLIITGVSPNWIMYTSLRCITGFFVGGLITVCFTLPMEFIGPKWRTFCGSFGLYEISTTVMGLVAFLTHSWRHTTLICGSVLTLLIPACIFWVPESIRWLTMKGRFEEADEIIRWMARVNKTAVPDLNILREIAGQDTKEKQTHYTYADLFRNKKLAIKTLVIMYCWFSCSAIAYGISTMYSTFRGTVYQNVLLGAAVSTPFSWSVIYVGNRFGRRKSFLGYMCIPCSCMVAVLIIGFIGKQEELGVLTSVLALAAKGSIISCWVLAAIYSAEVYPTVIRNLGCAAASMAARIGGIVAPQVAYLGKIGYWMLPYIMYAFLSITTGLLVFIFLPETNNKPLVDGADDDVDSAPLIVETEEGDGTTAELLEGNKHIQSTEI